MRFLGQSASTPSQSLFTAFHFLFQQALQSPLCAPPVRTFQVRRGKWPSAQRDSRAHSKDTEVAVRVVRPVPAKCPLGVVSHCHLRPRGLVLPGSFRGGTQAAGRRVMCPRLQAIRSRREAGARSVSLSSTPARSRGKAPCLHSPHAQLSMRRCISNVITMGYSRDSLKGQHKEGVIKCAMWARREPDTGG